MQMFTRIFRLIRRFCWILWEQVISFFKISNINQKYLTYEHKKVSNLEKLNLLPKIHKSLRNVPGRPVISKTCELTTLLWYRYIDNMFLIWAHGEEKLASILNVLNNYHLNITFISLLNNTFHF